MKQVKDWILQYDHIFPLDGGDLGRTALVQHDNDTGSHAPIQQRPRRRAFSLRPKIVGMVQDMLAQGLIVSSSSPLLSPMVLVKKRDDSYQFCVDYRKLNAVPRRDVFPLLRVDDLMERLGGARVFSCLDEASGYWHIPMSPQLRPKTAFVTHHGL